MPKSEHYFKKISVVPARNVFLHFMVVSMTTLAPVVTNYTTVYSLYSCENNKTKVPNAIRMLLTPLL